MQNKMKNKAYYNYRYFLPYAPEWGSADFCATRLNELLDFCSDAKIDAVQFFVNTLPGTYYMPAHSAAEQKHWAAWMKDAVAPALRKNGISYQLNFQMLLGVGTQGLDMRDEYDWELLVDHYGQETVGCACPIGPKFRKTMGEMLRLWAGTAPDIIWIDDDFRMHNHGLGKNELDFYCYCETHLNQFAEFAGKEYSREQLVAEILAPGQPTKLRQQWLDFLGRTMAESAAWIRKKVQGVSPQTRLAMMTSAPDVHSAEGRDWKEFLTALCGDYPPITRPCSGIYTGTAMPPRQQTITYRFMAHSIALVEDAFGAGVAEYGPELENTRFTTWCKSVCNSEYVLILGQLLGCPEITLSMNDLDGSPISDEPTNLTVLRDNKSLLDALAALELRKWMPQGVVFISDNNAARKVQVNENAKIQDIGLLRHFEDVLLQMGIPAFYATPQQAANGNDVVVLEGYTAWCPTDEEMKKILSGGVLLDGEAAWVLQQRGFAEYIGVNVINRNNYGLNAEIYNDGVLPGLKETRVPQRSTQWYEIKATNAIEVSRFIEPKFRHHLGSCIFENELGGRVAIYAGIADSDLTFASHAKLRWLHGLLRWMSKDSFCALPVIPHHGLTVMKTNGNKTMLAFANLGTDIIENLKVRLPKYPKNMKILEKSGKWQPTKIGIEDKARNEFCTIPCRLEVFDWLVAVF